MPSSPTHAAAPMPQQTDLHARFNALLQQHRGVVLKVAASYCRDPDDRVDLAQDIATHLWRAFPSYDPRRRFSTWMYRIALNVAVIGGVLLQAWCMALAISAMVQLQLLTQFNVAGPLLRTQHALARLRRWRTRVAPWLGVAFWVLWIAVADALWRALTGQTLPTDWLVLNLLVGVAGGIGTWLGFRRLQRAQHPWLERIDRAHAGTGVIRAERMLDEIARFQRD
ncbi:RNA polymerase sigma factor [Xanthomonas campestris]|uniref:RNA polymerase sigma factor n=1 Tax=Xanthomonas campestris TaxID=339 RepID=UPI00388D9CC4